MSLIMNMYHSFVSCVEDLDIVKSTVAMLMLNKWRRVLVGDAGSKLRLAKGVSMRKKRFRLCVLRGRVCLCAKNRWMYHP